MFQLFDRLTHFISKRIQQEEKREPDVSEGKIYCRSCGIKNPANHTFCRVCKMRLDVPPSEILNVCSRCDSAINYDDAYCFRCGKEVA
ncbi:MAG TPA: zinc ribbon domain-containing protein [Nitrososphaeraceae archaeon]|nr:zinc ribbon domain-containing protein [Nitrososphaeraceae archaeon]